MGGLTVEIFSGLKEGRGQNWGGGAIFFTFRF